MRFRSNLFHLFNLWLPIGSCTTIEKAVLPLLSYFCTLVKSQSGMSMGVYFWGLCSVPLTCVSIPQTMPHCLDYCLHVVGLRFGRMILPILFFFKVLLATWGPLPSYVSFRIGLPMFTKTILGSSLILKSNLLLLYWYSFIALHKAINMLIYQPNKDLF